ncbi:hypothetical protein GA0070560_1353 [Micromonospora halophytica]|uniref:Uncharacterized protein n=2 Tax=Micromonospora halophytica TaxID=47864 RepID=A0A1C5JKE1_9ACTN|nr:hypothetical protein GA0070560_1353 [Micromonospora halophytica]
MSWPGKLPTPTVQGDSATYPEVFPGVDLVMRATTTGFTHVLVIKTAQAAANPAVRTVELIVGAGVELSELADGSVRAMAGGQVVARSRPAVMWDSSPLTLWPEGSDVMTGSGPVGEAVVVAGAAQSTPEGPGDGARVGDVQTRVAGAGGLELIPDPSMLDGEDVSFPLFVDPSWSVIAAKWAYANSINSNWDLGGKTWVGMNPYDGTLYRSFFEFDMTTIKGKYVQSASVEATLYHSWSCSPTWVHLYRTSNITVASGARMSWSTRPLPSATWLDSAEGNANKSGGCGANQPDMVMQFSRAELTNDVRQAAENNWSLYTVGLCACNPQGQFETAQDRWKKFYTNKTKLVVTYTSKPTVTARATVPSTACVSGGGRPYINTATPQLRAQITDPEGAQVRAKFEWWVTGGSLIAGTTVGPGASGSWLAGGIGFMAGDVGASGDIYRGWHLLLAGAGQ